MTSASVPNALPLSPEDQSRIDRVWQAVATVPDPEIPPVNVVELGMIAAVRLVDRTIVVELTPTFSGCPALDMIREELLTALGDAGETGATVDVVFDPPWTSDRITDTGRAKLKAFGLAPPGKRCGNAQLPNLDATPCPFCDSVETDLESIFGPTLCRSIHYCRTCQQSFEHFKAV